MTLGIFANCIFCLKVKYLPRQQKKKLQTDIKENGGKFSFLLNPQCTHVIVDSADVLSRCHLNSIQKNDVQIANPAFIEDSVRQRRLLDVKNYDPMSPAGAAPPAEKISSSELVLPSAHYVIHEVQIEDPPLDNTPEKENIEVVEVSAENVEIPPFLQDFEVVKYNVLKKMGADGGPETVVVELQSSRDPGSSPFVIAAHFLLAEQKTRRASTGKQTSKGAIEYYESYVEDLKRQGFLLQEHFTAEATQLASEKLQALLLEEVISSGTLSQEVTDFLEVIWTEALGHLEHTLLKPVNSMSLNDVSKAEGILLLVKTALKNGDSLEQLRKTMAEFYRLLPHRHPASEEVNLRLLAQKEDLCQLVRDMVNVCETNLSKPNPPSLAKYRALRCKIEHVEENTEEFSRVRKEVLQSSRSEGPIDVLQIFKVGRVNEAMEFVSNLGNVQALFHGSPVRNILGILSRGLLLPKVAEDRGVQRTDVGNLGSGIYFSNSLSTSIKYAHAGETDGSRLLVICDVALGKCMDLFKKDFSLTEAPPGYDSVHGVSKTASVPTDFQDDEFVVYKTNQVKMKYIVKFCIPGDQIKEFHPHENTELEEHRAELSNVPEVEDFQLPDVKSLKDVKAGLQDASANPVPLESVHIRGRIIDFVAQVIVFQTYTNQSHVPIEAKYIFPLDDKAAVCGFEAFINGKHIVGEIKEKEEARQEYREAVSQGHGAYLMDQDTPDVFTVSVGNLPPRAKVLIKITYITELSIQSPVAIFFIPATVAPWQQNKALNENLQDTVETIRIKEIGAEQSFSLTMSIEMPYMIEFISSDTHELRQKVSESFAFVISTVEGSSLDSSGFSLLIGLRDAYLPRMWVEKHPEKESEACMLVFQPELADVLPDRREKNEVIICLDCSSSMEGVAFTQAKQIALYALSLLGEEQKVNVMRFGTGYKELFSYPKCITNNKLATEFIMSAAPSMGNTDFWKVLRYLSFLYPSEGLRNILLISDGHLQSESLTLQLVKRNIQHTRVFTCAVGSTANRHILRTLSQCGAGVFEYFNSKSKHSWKKQIEAQMARIHSPSCHSVSVKWQQLSRDAPEPLQAPTCVPSLFHNDRLLVYGFIPHCTQASLCAFIQEKEFCTMVSTTELQKTTGTMIHKLAARALIRDYEDGILHDNETNHEMKKNIMKSLIIELSKENSLITQFTSFVAVEKRDVNEVPLANAPSISELVAKEDVDFLPYVSWQEKQPETFTSQPFSISSEGNEELSLLTAAKKCKVKTRKMRNLKVSEDFEGTPAMAQSPTTAQSDFHLPLSVCPQPVKLKKGRKFQKLRMADEPRKAPVSMVSSAPAVTAGFSFLSARHSSSAFLSPLCNISLPPPPPSLVLLPPSPSLPSPPGHQFSLSPVGFIPTNSCRPMSNYSHKLAKATDICDSEPPLRGFRGASPKDTSSRGTGFRGGTFSDSFAGSKDFDPGKFSQDLNNIVSSPKAPELAATQRSPLRSPPKPLSVPPLVVCEFSSELPQSHSFHFQSGSVHRSPNYRMSDMASLRSALSLDYSAWDCVLEEADSLDGGSFETETDEAAAYTACEFLTSMETPSHEEFVIGDDEGRQSPVSWTSLFALQTEDGFWKLTPELGLILKLNVNALLNSLEEKGIRSLGTKGRERLLDLIATLLVLQFLYTKLEQEGMAAKSLIKMDDVLISRNIPWAFENIKKAREWARRTEGQYPSICQRLELGKDWESATKQLLGIQHQGNTSLHRILHYSQG
eukprot:XP_017455426.1 PREDICTED: poly [ADP-ribose] polymerase 4 isoform X1 [Rattus norvegicus]